MGKIPILDLEYQDPEIHNIVEDGIDLIIRGCARIKDAARDTLYPPSPEEERRQAEQIMASVPREFDRAFQKDLQGKIKKDEDYSSECEEASFAYYRRMLRTELVGATDEGMDDVAARKLGLNQPSILEKVRQDFLENHKTAVLDSDTAARVGMTSEAAKDMLYRKLQASHERQAQVAEEQDAQAEYISWSGKQVLTNERQVVRALGNATTGIVAGVFIFKVAAMVARRLGNWQRGKGTKQLAQRKPSVNRTGSAMPRVQSQEQQPQQQAQSQQSQPAARTRRPTTRRR